MKLALSNKIYVSKPVWSQDFKNAIFYFYARSKNTENGAWKWRHQRMWFLGLNVCQKWIYQYRFWHARWPDMFLQHIFWFLKTFKISGLNKIYIKVSVIFSFGVKIIFTKHYKKHFKESYISFILLLLICILLLISIYGDFFRHLSIFDQTWRDIG